MIKPNVFDNRIFGAVLAGTLFALMVTIAMAAPAPGVAGDWQGTLDTGGGTLRVVVHISQDKDGKLTGALDSPDQGASGIAITAITYKEPDLHFEVGSIGGSYEGKMNKENSQIAGDWKQGGGSLPLTLKRVTK
jgi:hypothetical protein